MKLVIRTKGSMKEKNFAVPMGQETEKSSPEKIEQEVMVPLPETRGRPLIYNWASIEIGCSVFLPGVTIRQLASNSQILERHGVKVNKRTVMEDGVQGVRIWRLG